MALRHIASLRGWSRSFATHGIADTSGQARAMPRFYKAVTVTEAPDQVGAITSRSLPLRRRLTTAGPPPAGRPPDHA
jgi:hypothetical protein